MPINPKAKLAPNILDIKTLEQKPTRDGYGLGLVKAGDENPNVVALCADLTESTRTEAFAKKYPERFVELGVAEQNMASVAAGMSLMGKIPYIASYATFSPGRNWEQIRTTIAYNDANVKIAGAHAGVSVGPDGATHQATEDMAIMRAMPNMKVFSPCDMWEAKKVTYAISKIYGPCYARFGREKTPVFTTEETPFEIGKAQIFWDAPEESRFSS
jgi:transketolase